MAPVTTHAPAQTAHHWRHGTETEPPGERGPAMGLAGLVVTTGHGRPTMFLRFCRIRRGRVLTGTQVRVCRTRRARGPSSSIYAREPARLALKPSLPPYKTYAGHPGLLLYGRACSTLHPPSLPNQPGLERDAV